MVFIDYEAAASIVSQLYPNASNPMLDIELQLTKGDNYRPYVVAAKFMMSAYRLITKADTVNFQYNTDSIERLLDLQKGLDKTDKNIPDGQTVDDLKADFCTTCDDIGGIGINVY